MTDPRQSKLPKIRMKWIIGLGMLALLAWGANRTWDFLRSTTLETDVLWDDTDEVNQRLHIYLVDSDDVFPPVQSQTTFRSLLNSQHPFPGSNYPERFTSSDYLKDIRFNTNLSNVRMSSIPDPDKVVTVWTPFALDLKGKPTKYFVGLVSGKTLRVDPKDWPAYRDSLDLAFPRVSDKFYPPDFELAP